MGRTNHLISPIVVEWVGGLDPFKDVRILVDSFEPDFKLVQINKNTFYSGVLILHEIS
jgi:hypothetical protein